MPTETFQIAASKDDAFAGRDGSSYPPSNAPFINNTSNVVSPERSYWGNNYYYEANGFMRFDTSALPDDAAVTGAVLQVYVTELLNGNSRSLSAEYYDWGDAQGVITGADYTNTPGTNALSGKTIASLIASAYNDIVLDGFSGINPLGATSLRLHISDPIPTNGNYAYLASFDNTTGLIPPRLVITYGVVDTTPPAAPTGLTAVKSVA